MKNTEIKLDDGMELCDDCGLEYNKKEIEECIECGKKLCEHCISEHSEEHAE